MVGEPRSDRISRMLLVLLLLMAAVTTAVVAEAEVNYASTAKIDRTVATVVDAERADGGLRVRLEAENPLNRPLRIQYVVLEISDGDTLATVGIPYARRGRLSPGTTRFGVSVVPRFLGGVSLESELQIGGHIAVKVYNDFEFKVRIRRTEVTP